MGLETARLLIVVEDLDHRPFTQKKTAINTGGSTVNGAAGLPTKLSPIANDDEVLTALRAVDLHIVEAATYWRSHVQAVAIYSAYASHTYSEVSEAGVQFFGSDWETKHAQSQQLDVAGRSTENDANLPWPFKSPELSPEPNGHTKRNRLRPVADYCPTHVVICTPNATIISWTTRNQIPSVVLLSNWREPLGWWQRWQHQQLIKQLNHQSVAWIGAHGAYACKILCASGIKPQKLIPWEWPQPQLSVQYSPRQLRHTRDTISLIYVGPIHTTAGVDDLIWAVRHLHERGQLAHLQVICETSDERAALGAPPLPQPANDTLHQPSLARDSQRARHPVHSLATDSLSENDDILGEAHGFAVDPVSAVDGILDVLDPDMRRLKALVQSLALSDYVSFTPVLPEPSLLKKMRAADLVVLPGYDRSWPAATPPSLQLAMATRTPVVASDHDHFKEHLFHGVNAMIFPEGNAKSMAHRIERVMGQPQLYAQLSEALDIPLHAIKVPARWADLIDRWLQSDQAPPIGTHNYQQLCNWAFSSGRYQSITPMQKPPKGWKKTS